MEREWKMDGVYSNSRVAPAALTRYHAIPHVPRSLIGCDWSLMVLPNLIRSGGVSLVALGLT